MVSGTIDAGSTPAGSILPRKYFLGPLCARRGMRQGCLTCKWQFALYVFIAGKNHKTKPYFQGQQQSQWKLMKDAALDKDPQSVVFKVFIAVSHTLY